MPAYAPGPWEAEDGEIIANGAVIATVLGPDDFPCLDPDDFDEVAEECHANASLIAAAPDLYEACLNALIPVKDAWAYQVEGNDLWPVFEKLRAALNKAQGREG